MADAIPDLWRANEDAVRLYQLYLCRLQMNDRHERVVAACRSIRRFAARGPGSREGLFAISIEIHALCELKDYRAAWRRLRLQEEIAFGERIDLRSRRWSKADAFELAFSYAPLAYFLGRYRQGCEFLETSLDFWLRGKIVEIFDILSRVYNGEIEPPNRCRVTLSHFHGRLGRDLRQWRRWETFVNGFHPRLFRLIGIARAELMADSGCLAAFSDKLIDLQKRRISSGVAWGQSDLIDRPAKVGKRQAATQRKRNEATQRLKPVSERFDRKLQELFPELRELPS